jgi:hypothetical protein
MRKLSVIFVLFLLTSCEKYVVNNKDVNLSGEYVVSKLDVTNDNQTSDSLYTIGSTYINKSMPDPLDSIVVNRFHVHFDYSTIRLNRLGVTPSGRDLWEYGSSPNEIFYRILSNNAYNSGFLQFDYYPKNNSVRTLTFLIEDDGFETLQLKSYGEKQVITLYLTRVGP